MPDKEPNPDVEFAERHSAGFWRVIDRALNPEPEKEPVAPAEEDK